MTGEKMCALCYAPNNTLLNMAFRECFLEWWKFGYKEMAFERGL